MGNVPKCPTSKQPYFFQKWHYVHETYTQALVTNHRFNVWGVAIVDHRESYLLKAKVLGAGTKPIL